MSADAIDTGWWVVSLLEPRGKYDICDQQDFYREDIQDRICKVLHPLPQAAVEENRRKGTLRSKGYP